MRPTVDVVSAITAVALGFAGWFGVRSHHAKLRNESLLDLAYSDIKRGSAPVPAEPARRAAYQAACAAGDSAACVLHQARFLPLPDDGRFDREAVLASCAAGGKVSCLVAALRLRSAEGVGRLCDAGEFPACSVAAELLMDSPAPDDAVERAMALHRKACDGGFLQGCVL